MKSFRHLTKRTYFLLGTICALGFLFQNCSGKFQAVSLGSDNGDFGSNPSYPSDVAIKSLSRFELFYAAMDILEDPSLDLGAIVNLPQDPKVAGFESAGLPSYDQVQIQSRLNFAEAMAAKAVRSNKVIACQPDAVTQPGWSGCFRDTVVRFAERAFRRTLEPREEQKLKAIFELSSADVVSELTALASAPMGNVDVIDSSLNFVGWSIDPAWSDRPVEIQIYIDGPIGGAAAPIATAFTNVLRSDVNAYFANLGQDYPGDHGFIGRLPARYADGQAHTIYAYAVGGPVTLIATKSFTFPSAGASVIPTPPQLSTHTTEALKSTFSFVLMAPAFQLRTLYAPDSMDPSVRSQMRLANNLSLYLGATVPDSVTTKLALEAKLTDPVIYKAEVDRLMAKYSDRFSFNVIGQWMGYRDFLMLPGLGALESNMVLESVLVFKEIIDKNLPIESIVRPGFTYANQALANHYGLSGFVGSAASFMKMPQSVRGGIFQQGSILSLSAANGLTKPIVRGKWVNWNLLCRSIPSPGPELLQQIADAKKAADPAWSVSERLANHRNTGAACLACHRYMDPLGLALENYGPTGLWRTSYLDGKPVIASGDIDGQSFNDVRDLEQIVVARDDFKNCVTKKIMTHALGRPLSLNDELTAVQISNQKTNLKDIIQAIALSPAFLQQGSQP